MRRCRRILCCPSIYRSSYRQRLEGKGGSGTGAPLFSHPTTSQNEIPMYFYYNTAKGPVTIVHRTGKWHLVFEDADLGSYVSAHKAAREIGGGYIPTSPAGTDLKSLVIPPDLEYAAFAP